MGRKLWGAAIVGVGIVIGAKGISKQYGLDKDEIIRVFGVLSDRLGIWAIPVYVALHTLTLALCLPYAVFFEAGASLLFGFLPAILCVFFAKILAASLSFWIGRSTMSMSSPVPRNCYCDHRRNRFIFKSSSSAMEWAQGNKHFHVLSKGVEQDGWKFVLLARFSPVPSYVINYALAATNVRFLVDFLLPTVLGCLPMILQNTSIGSLAGAAVASASGSQKSQIWSYIFPIMGIMSSILISLRIRKYSKSISIEPSEVDINNGSEKTSDSSQPQTNREEAKDVKKRR